MKLIDKRLPLEYAFRGTIRVYLTRLLVFFAVTLTTGFALFIIGNFSIGQIGNAILLSLTLILLWGIILYCLVIVKNQALEKQKSTINRLNEPEMLAQSKGIGRLQEVNRYSKTNVRLIKEHELQQREIKKRLQKLKTQKLERLKAIEQKRLVEIERLKAIEQKRLVEIERLKAIEQKRLEEIEVERQTIEQEQKRLVEIEFLPELNLQRKVLEEIERLEGPDLPA